MLEDVREKDDDRTEFEKRAAMNLYLRRGRVRNPLEHAGGVGS